MDDGTYIIENGKVIGRQTLEQAEMIEEVAIESRWEPLYIYMFRYIFLCVIIVIAFILMLWLAMILIYVCMLTAAKYSDGEYGSARIAINGRLMNAMKRIPYSDFILQEARDCPICLESFTRDDEVFQLKCSKFHLFHAHCLEGYLTAPGLPSGEDKKCPVCRRPIEYEENAVQFEGGIFNLTDHQFNQRSTVRP